MHAFLSNLAKRQTDWQTDRQTDEQGQKHVHCTSFFVGGNNNDLYDIDTAAHTAPDSVVLKPSFVILSNLAALKISMINNYHK